MVSFEHNETEIRNHIGLIQDQPDSPFEVDMIEGKNVYSGVFRDADTCIAAMNAMSFRTPDDVPTRYIVCNTIDPALFSRKQSNRFLRGVNRANDGDIIRIKFWLKDIDPNRPDGTSSTAEELEHANQKQIAVHDLLKEHGFAEPAIACSGNGWHMYHRVDLAPTDENKKLIAALTDNLSALMSDTYRGGAKIDTTSKNPGRLLKLIGTPALKGTSTAERPHRMSKFYKLPDPLEVTPIETLISFNEFMEAVLHG